MVGSFYAFSPELAKANIGYEASRFPEIAGIAADSFWFRSRNRLIIWALRHYFPEANNFLEIGCGTGYALSAIETAFPHLSIVGSEVHYAGLQEAVKRLKKAELIQMDACKIPFIDEFDVIGAFDVLEHIEDDGTALSQIHKAVRQGGGIILTVPQHPFLWSQFDEHSCHLRRYKAFQLKLRVEQTGFRVTKITSFVSLLLPLMMLVRLIRDKSCRKDVVMTELKLGKLANSIFEKVLDFERVLIRFGLPFPFGGSLLLIARKK